jgi:hypothetical protein
VVQQTLEVAEGLKVHVPSDLLVGDMLRNVIVKSANRYNQKVVVLIDEYDKPYTDFVNNPEMAEKVREVLRNYYIQIKANDEYIRFTFITGISKFARFGVFSALNSLFDISVMPEYAKICGYTQEEIIHYFPNYIEETARSMHLSTDELLQRMQHYYNGFTFDRNAEVRLYNPFSTLSFFREKSFSNYWMESGASKVVSDYMKHRNLTVEQFRNYPVSESFVRSPGDMDTTPPEGFLYQSGYLTLRPGIGGNLSLDYPNTEVLDSMSNLLTQNLLANNSGSIQHDLLLALTRKDVEKVVEMLNCLLASIPYDDFSRAAKQSLYRGGYKIPAIEWLYRSTIFAFLRGCGIVVSAEMHTHMGRPDLVVSFDGKVWVIEIKVAYEGQGVEEKAHEAYRQIVDKDYAAPYPGAVCLGIGIDDAKRQIGASRSA